MLSESEALSEVPRSADPVPSGPYALDRPEGPAVAWRGVVWRRARLMAIVVGTALFMATLQCLQGRLLFPGPSWRSYLGEAVIRTFPSWLMLALLAPPVMALANRARIERRTWPVVLPIHLVTGLAFAIVHLAGVAWFAARHAGGAWYGAFADRLAAYMMIDLFVYGGIVAAVHAFHYQAEMRAREVAAERLQAGLVRARLQVLRAQLNPHFLFNALNAISTLALKGEREDVVRTASALGEVLRASLDESTAQEIPLADELAILDRYLEVERIRFGARLGIGLDVAAGVDRALVPSMILQPIVENAVRHGVAGRRGSGRVVIEARRRDDALVVEVRDSGPGFGGAPGADGHRIGLVNTRERIAQLYGPRGSVSFGRAEEGGARVVLVFPFRVAGENVVPGASS